MHLFNTLKGPKLIMLVGIPASGKSTWTEQFLAKHDNAESWVSVSSDAFIDKYAADKGITYDEAFNAVPFKTFDSQYRALFRQSLNKKNNIILDRTHVSPNSRRKMLSQIPKEYEVVAVAFELDRDEINRRLEARRIATGKYIPASVIDNMVDNYVRPSTSEGFSNVQLITNRGE